MWTIKFFLFYALVFTNISATSQQGKCFFIKDKDTLKSIDVKFFLETPDGLLPFSSNNKLIYNKQANPDSINSVVVVYRGDTLSFNNIKEQINYSHLPIDIIMSTRPQYRNLFAEKTNLYFTIDAYPFETSDRKKFAEKNKNRVMSVNKILVAELQFSDKEMMIYTPGKSAFYHMGGH